MAWRVKQFQVERSITELKNDRGEKISRPTAINDAFKVYYKRLHSPENHRTIGPKSFLISQNTGRGRPEIGSKRDCGRHLRGNKENEIWKTSRARWSAD